MISSLILHGLPSQAAEIVDIALQNPSLELAPRLPPVETDRRSVTIEWPASSTGLKDILQLDAVGKGPIYRWRVLNLSNSSAKMQSAVLSVAAQGFAGSGLFWPKPSGPRFLKVVSGGPLQFEPISATGSDAFALTLEPGNSAVIAFEVASAQPLPATLWQRGAYESQRDYSAFFRGALLGIALLLAAGIGVLYAMRSRPVFLAAAGFAACCVGFILLETGHLSKLIAAAGVPAFTILEARAVVEGLMASLLLVCLVMLAELRRVAPSAGNMVLLLAGLSIAIPVYGLAEPLIACALARGVFAVTAVAGFVTIFVLWRRGEARAETVLVPWSAITLWTFVAAVAALTEGSAPLVTPLLLAGLVAVEVAFAFTLAHIAFSQGFVSRHLFHEAGRRVLALAGAQAHVWDWRPESGDLHVGEELEQVLGLPRNLISQGGVEAFLDLIHPADRSAYIAAIASGEQQGRGFIEREFRLRRNDGTYRWYQLRARAMPGNARQPVRCIGTLSDITTAKLSEERLLSDAVYDRVTGLPNRALFVDRVGRAIASADANSSAGLHVLLADIDRFKSINDGLGHEAGDRLLNVIGRRLAALMGPEDTVARLPGDQFAVLFAAAKPERDIIAFAELLRKAISRPINLENQEVFLTASIGVAPYRETGQTPNQILKDAAIALYEAKRRAQDTVEFFSTSMRDDRAELVVRENELRRAIEREEFEVHYQPIARLDDMNLAGFEALVRWRHPALGLLAPESFIGLAEQTGMIKDIGRAVLNEAARQLGIWQRAFRTAQPLFVAVNISSAQLIETDLIDDIKFVLHREGVHRETLKIEVTESIVMQYPERAGQILDRLRELGVGLACDDFGTGYSSLASLRRLPFDTLKVDKSFVDLEGQDERAGVILQSIIAMAHALRLTVVAEGIESQEQVDRLGELNCDFGQGFFIGRPMTAKQVNDALAGLPYASASGRTAITWLWEKAAKDPVQLLVAEELTGENIERALARMSPISAHRAAPMAPRLSKPAEEERPAAAPRKRRRRKKPKPEKEQRNA